MSLGVSPRKRSRTQPPAKYAVWPASRRRPAIFRGRGSIGVSCIAGRIVARWWRSVETTETTQRTKGIPTAAKRRRRTLRVFRARLFAVELRGGGRNVLGGSSAPSLDGIAACQSSSDGALDPPQGTFRPPPIHSNVDKRRPCSGLAYFTL